MSSAVREATAAVEALVPQTSAYLGSIARARSALSTLSRALTPAEIAVLRGNGNRAATEDWAGVRVRADAGTGFDAGRVSNCTFGGTSSTSWYRTQTALSSLMPQSAPRLPPAEPCLENSTTLRLQRICQRTAQ